MRRQQKTYSFYTALALRREVSIIITGDKGRRCQSAYQPQAQLLHSINTEVSDVIPLGEETNKHGWFSPCLETSLAHFRGSDSYLTYFSLLDINECTANTHNCHAQAFCNNTADSYRCTCNPGYSGSGMTCAGWYYLFFFFFFSFLFHL